MVDHAGLVARFTPRRRDVGAALGISLLAGVWNALMCFGTATQGLDCAIAGMWTFVPFLWFLAIGMTASLATRRELRLMADGVVLTVTRFGIPRRTRLPLRGLTVKPGRLEGSRGTLHLWLDLEGTVDGRPVRAHLPLPDGSGPREQVVVAADQRWLIDVLGRAIAAAEASPDGATAPPEALRALLERA